MFVITNRVVDGSRTDLDAFGKQPNSQGPNELRFLNLTRTAKAWTVDLLDDELSKQEVLDLASKYKLELDMSLPWYASLKVACEVFERARQEQKHVLVFVHGYNNDIRDVVETASELEKLYNVIVIPFTWPANGGGKLSGTAAYLNDKDDARVSSTALSRAVEKIQYYHAALTGGRQKILLQQAEQKHPDNPEKARALYTRLQNQECKTTVNLLCHSMGNYVLKHAMYTHTSSLRKLTFDTVALVAADTNNPGHEEWLQQLPVRNRLYVVINENDNALAWSRRKPGDEQSERLGHHLRNLVANNAYYIDLTRSKGVGSDHSYFKGKPVAQNAALRQIFRRIFEGGRAEDGLTYHADLNLYRS